ncbi:MAG: hypothetical protein PHZ26_05785 [Candidatus Gracilibacteria bacterium]|nr:hypothetical protein [Candidatus Gracilibacteria bacterium]MDD2909223.1 hypothetical protein [Candidatus Gracilibacteria bacterium]
MFDTKIVFLPTKDQKNSEVMEMSEIFELMMRNIFNPDCKEIVSEFINSDCRELSEVGVWFLEFKNFTSKEIPKMETTAPLNENCYA